MADPTEDLFDGLDRPRALPGPLRDRLEQQLLAAAGAPETVPLGAELDERLRTTLTDPLAAALAGIDGPRPLSPELRGSLSRRLARRRGNAARVLGAAAAVVLVAALAVVLGQSGGTTHRTGPSSAAAPNSTPLPGSGTAAGGVGVTGDSAGAGGSTGASPALSTRGQVPAPAVPGGESSGQSSAAAATERSAVPVARPDAGPVSGGTAVTLTGRGLSTTTQVYFGRRAASSYDVVSDSTIRAVTPPAAGPGAVDVVVLLRSGASYRLASAFSYLPRPTVTSLAPTTGSTSGGTWVSISGTALSRATSVRFGGTDATRVEVVSDGQLRALSPQHLAGPVDVVVTTPGGTSATGSGDRYTYLP